MNTVSIRAPYVGIGVFTSIGHRHTMEDKYSVTVAEPRHKSGIHAMVSVIDGHGGDHVAKLLADSLHDLDTPRVLDDFIVWDLKQMYMRFGNTIPKSEKTTGAVAVTVVVKKSGDLFFANCGDCEAIVGLRSGGYEVQTISHSAKNPPPQELARMNEKIGFDCCRSGRVFGSLAVTRAFGDWAFVPPITHEPYMAISHTNKSDFIVLASDGLWGILSHTVVYNITNELLIKEKLSPVKIAERLVELALTSEKCHLKDNICVAVISLLPPMADEIIYSGPAVSF